MIFCSQWQCHISTVWDQTILDESTHPHRAGFLRDYLQNLGVERMEWPSCSPDLNLIEYMWDQLRRTVCARVTNTATLQCVTNMDSMPEAEILDCYGCLDILIFNSSMKVKAPAQSLSLEVDKLLMDNNYFGPVTLAKGVLPSMISRRSGHLLLVHSIQGRLTVPFGTTYAASKHAVQAAFDCPRAEVEEDGISVSTVSHTFITHLLSLKISSVISSPCLLAAVLYTTKPLGVSPDEAATEIVKTLNNKRKEVVIAPSLPKVAIYARSFFPNMFFLVMAAGVKHAAPSEKI
uniref:Dehydrogenase/reductase 7C n=1 Tax=Amphilophus citrinellus TaxID=61819 RepID=A0A3Q0QVV9_AMPCI